VSARSCGFANSCKTFSVSFDCILSVSFCEILKVFRFSWSTSPSHDREPVVKFICLTVHPVQCSIVRSWKEYGRKVMFLPSLLLAPLLAPKGSTVCVGCIGLGIVFLIFPRISSVKILC